MRVCRVVDRVVAKVARREACRDYASKVVLGAALLQHDALVALVVDLRVRSRARGEPRQVDEEVLALRGVAYLVEADARAPGHEAPALRRGEIPVGARVRLVDFALKEAGVVAKTADATGVQIGEEIPVGLAAAQDREVARIITQDAGRIEKQRFRAFENVLRGMGARREGARPDVGIQRLAVVEQRR